MEREEYLDHVKRWHCADAVKHVKGNEDGPHASSEEEDGSESDEEEDP